MVTRKNLDQEVNTNIIVIILEMKKSLSTVDIIITLAMRNIGLVGIPHTPVQKKGHIMSINRGREKTENTVKNLIIQAQKNMDHITNINRVQEKKSLEVDIIITLAMRNMGPVLSIPIVSIVDLDMMENHHTPNKRYSFKMHTHNITESLTPNQDPAVNPAQVIHHQVLRI